MTARLPLHLLSDVYARIASRRRHWYAGHPGARRRLANPVISVGNLAVGGSGKTPVVAALARMLFEQGERPAILSRGYARRRPADGVLVVSDPEGVREPVERSGDEPQMLARSLSGIPVLVSADRHLAGVLAERRFGCTVHLLDDGFQHLTLARDVDLVLLAPGDAEDRVLPAGRLRERIAAASAADAVILVGSESGSESDSGPGYRAVVSAQEARTMEPFGAARRSDGRRAVAVAGIARPQRFFDTARGQGWTLVKEMTFRDHHWFSAGDVRAMAAAARAADADVILTTEKDAVRIAPRLASAGDLRSTFAFLPIVVRIEPAAVFNDWIRERLATARATV